MVNDGKRRIAFYFTLLELVVSCFVFSILLCAGFYFYNTASAVNTNSSGQLELLQNAQTALNLIARDIECLYYGGSGTAFWHWRPDQKPSQWSEYRNELIAFVAQTGLMENNNCTSLVNKIKYQKYYSDKHTEEFDGWLRRSATGNLTSKGETDSDWNYMENFVVGRTCKDNAKKMPEAVFTANSTACNRYEKVIPNVVDLRFDCFDKDGNIIPPTNFTEDNKTYNLLELEPSYNRIPCTIDISLTLMDSKAWQKWIALGGNSDPDKDSGKAKEYRLRKQKTFKRTVIVGANKQQI